jgi:hypothetical protein
MLNNAETIERIRTAAALDAERDKLDQARAAWQADLDQLRAEWAGSFGEQLQQHEERMRQLRDQHAAWMRKASGMADEPAPPQEPAQRERPGTMAAGQASTLPPAPAGRPDVGQGRARSATGLRLPPVTGPGQRTPHATEVDFSRMSMQEYATRRAEFGVQDATDMRRLFGS